MYLERFAELAGRVGDPDAADRAADALQTLWPDQALAWYWSGRALLDIDPARAVDCFERALELRPDLGHVHGNLGHVLSHTGRLEEAATAYREQAKRQPGSAIAHLNLGVHLLLAGATAEALELTALQHSQELGLDRRRHPETLLPCSCEPRLQQIGHHQRNSLIERDLLALGSLYPDQATVEVREKYYCI